MKLSHVVKSIPVAALAAAVLLPVAPSGASTSQITIVQDDQHLLPASAHRRAKLLDEMKSLGADVVKVRIDWRIVAPHATSKKKPHGFSGEDPNKYPAAHWRGYDEVLRAIVSRGMKPYLMIGGRAPRWASHKSWVDRPSPKEFGRFVQAIGTRYSGTFVPRSSASALPTLLPGVPLPRVTIFSAWNEANLKSWLSPQWSHGRPASPRLYRQLVMAAHKGLAKSGHGGDEFLIGELLPFARSGGSMKTKVRPLEFLREMACVDSHFHAYTGTTAKEHGCSKFKTIPGTGLAYHPYTLAGGPDVPTPNPDDASIGELGRVLRVLDRLSHAHRLESHRMPLWVTEFGFQTNPPDRYATPIKRVPDLLGQSEWLAYRNPRVASYAQYPIVDDPIDSSGNGFQSGLRRSNGKKKKSVYKAFQLPLFVQKRSNSVVEVFGGVRTGASGQQVTIESRHGRKGKFKPLPGGTVQLGSEGYFDRVFTVSSATKRQYRFRYSGGKSRATGVHS